MTKRVFIIHRWDGSSKDDWRPWLKVELEKLSWQVVIPDMPDTGVPMIEKWVEHLSNVVGQPDSDTYFVGHSIGCQTILRYLQSLDSKVGGAVFVAGWFTLTGLEDESAEEIAKPWITTPISFEKVRKVLPKSVAILSSNDPFVPLEETRTAFENKVGSEVVVIPNAGHITGDDGFVEVPEIVEQLQQL